MSEIVELDVTTVEESVTVNVTEEGQVQVAVFAEKGGTGPAGPAGPNSVTSSTTTNLTGFISGNGTAITGSPNAIFDDSAYAEFNSGSELRLNAGSQASFEIGAYAEFNSGSEAYFDSGGKASFLGGSIAQFANSTIKLQGVTFQTSINFTEPTANRTITLPDASGTVALTDDPRFTDARTPLAHTHVVSDIVSIASQHLIGRHAGGTGAGQAVDVGNGLEFQGSGIRRSALTGDITASAGSNATTLANDAVSNAKLANVPTATIKGRITAGTGDPEDLTAAQARTVTAAAHVAGNNTFGGVQTLVIPGPYETDADAAFAGVPLNHLYYQNSGAVAASVDIPSLDLAFAADKTLTARFGPTPTFTRASTATFIGSNGLIESTAINVPRFDHDPVTLVCRGLLIEESRQNALLNSDTLVTQNVTVTAAARTLSFYGTGTVVLSGAHSATVVGTGTYPARTTLTFTPTAGTLTLTVTGTVQFAQLEIGAFATSYIPTTIAALTRSADVCSITGANFTSFYNQSEGTALVETNSARSSEGRHLSNLPGARTIEIFGSTNVDFLEVSSIQIVRIATGVTYPAKIALAYAVNNYRSAARGVLGGVDTNTGGVLPTAAGLVVGSHNSQSYINGHIARVQYFRKSLPNAKLITLTA